MLSPYLRKFSQLVFSAHSLVLGVEMLQGDSQGCWVFFWWADGGVASCVLRGVMAFSSFPQHKRWHTCGWGFGGVAMLFHLRAPQNLETWTLSTWKRVCLCGIINVLEIYPPNFKVVNQCDFFFPYSIKKWSLYPYLPGPGSFGYIGYINWFKSFCYFYFEHV